MHKLILTFTATLTAVAAGDPRADLKQAALAGAPAAHHAALTFLIDHMPQRDVGTVSAEFLKRNVSLAYQARNEFPWGKQIPEEIFFNDVVPYASLDEARDDCRADFLERFRRHVANCKTAAEAEGKVAEVVQQETGVSYNTKRRAPNQGPRESMELKMASCTGLSILLVDALRSIGLPARVAGIAS